MKIAQISDIHCGEVHFVPGLMERAINEINDLEPDIVVCSGDLTAMGFKNEYVEAKAYLDRLECDCVVVIPGNHDSRNVGYIHFEELFGARNRVVQRDGVTIVAVDSTEPDLDTVRSAAAATAGSKSSSTRAMRSFGSSCSTTTSCRSQVRDASATSSTTPATRSSAYSAPASTSSSPATSTFPTPGGSRTCS